MEEYTTPTTGQLEREFRIHNENLTRNNPRLETLTAIQFHDAVYLVKNGLWNEQKPNLFVILPKKIKTL